MIETLTERRIQAVLYAELTALAALPNFTPVGWFESDWWRVTQSRCTHEYEIKLSMSDAYADKRKRYKHKILSGDSWYNKTPPTCFWYVAPAGVINHAWVPEYAGLIEVVQGDGSDRLHTIKLAPRRKVKVAARVMDQMLEASLHRYHRERARADDWRRRFEELKSGSTT